MVEPTVPNPPWGGPTVTPAGWLKVPMDGTGGTPDGATGRLKLDDDAMAAN